MSLSPQDEELNPNPGGSPDTKPTPAPSANGQPPPKPRISVKDEFEPAYDYAMIEGAGADSGKPPDPDDKEEHVSVFRNRNFMLLWIAQALSQTAQQTLNITLVLYVGKLTNDSPTQTSIVTVCFLLPGVFFSAIAGVFVDRFRKRTTLLITNLTRALIVPWLFFMSGLPLPIALPTIFIITLFFSTISQFFNPAEAAIIPLLVKPHQLTRANSLFQVTLFATLFLGTSLLGPLLPGIIGAENVFLVMSALYAVCVVLVWWLPDNEQLAPREKEQTVWETARDLFKDVYVAWKFIRTDTQIWLAIIYLSTVQTVLFTMTAIGIPFVGDKGLRQPPNTIIFVLAPLSIGLGIAVALVNVLSKPSTRMKVLVRACAGLGLAMISVGLVKPIADLWVVIFTPGVPIGGPGLIFLLIVLSMPFGFAIGLLNIPSLTILQERSPKVLVGRVFAAYFTFANGVSIIPILFAGALGDIFGSIFGPTYGVVPVFFLFGLIIIGVAYYSYQRGKR